ncbi:tRNA glutamyl-Q(34) synthetase GluQRS [Hellea balneolensis]|uniref:tRNA glutamyl-Q(34) synthetase GluQRS n=1 Tax=Hellea balneolensis TaxID=287478 RepID=UPI000425B12D|nr:tRNA glutamyl-Q(34) synthetase GluQRS [Hellea balneolensis]
MRTRFAPSPTGRLHLGHALAAKEAFGFAATENGQCLLRIEDIDHTRCKQDFKLGIYQDLNWLGFDWPIPVRVQSRHYMDYAKVVASLLERCLAYPCTLTRSKLKAGQRSELENTLRPSDYLAQFTVGDNTPHPKPSLPYAMRLNLSKSLELMRDHSLVFDETGLEKKNKAIDAKFALNLWAASGRPDPIIARKDIGVSYHIAVTHDDHLQGITHVVRGMDLFEETPLHVLIQHLMGWPTPIYHHHELLTREDGEKLSKRGLDTSLHSLRENGLTAAQVLAMASP